MMTGYLHPKYAESLAEFGLPRELAHCGGWILERQIPGFSDRDAMGCYPFFACQDWSRIGTDLEELEKADLVSLALVADPFGDYKLADLKRFFAQVTLFKEHFVTDMRQPISKFVSKHHRYYARKALKQVQVEICSDPIRWLDAWVALYDTLIERHHISGIRAFSREAFAKQLKIPGIIMFRAVAQKATVGVNLIYVQGDVAYTHLSAFSPRGYDLRAAYAVRWVAIEYLAEKVRWLNLGAGSGVKRKKPDGLSKFKQGWSTETRPVYFCARNFRPKRYEEIVKAKGFSRTDYFPAYRKDEFS